MSQGEIFIFFSQYENLNKEQNGDNKKKRTMKGDVETRRAEGKSTTNISE